MSGVVLGPPTSATFGATGPTRPASGPRVMHQLQLHPQSLAARGSFDDEPPSPLLFPDLGVKRILENIRRLENGATEALHTLLRFAGASSGEKSVRICVLALDLGERLGLSSLDIRDLEFSALLHDIGFLGLPSGLLAKPGLLTPEERAQLRQHPELGEAILGGIPGFERVSRIVGGHHERPDGHGYPDCLRGPDIPLPARILSVAETFHAMLTDRSYRSRLPLTEAVQRLRADAGARFDERVVELLGHKADGYERLLSDGRLQVDFAAIDPYASPPEIEN